MALKGKLRAMNTCAVYKVWERLTEVKRGGDMRFGMLLLPLVLKG